MNWYNIQNSINNKLSISIDGAIGSEDINAKDFIEEVQGANVKDIELTINSGGGSVFEAFAIYDYLKTSSLNVNVKIIGTAASAASVLALSGDSLPTMTENSVIMIHNAWMPVVSMAGMNSDEIRAFQEELGKQAELMDKINLKIAKIYSKATKLSLKKAQDMMAEETWIFSEDAEKFGFVSEITPAYEIAAMVSPDVLNEMGYKNTPKDYVNQLNNVNMSKNDEKSFLEMAKAYFTKEVSNEAKEVKEEPKAELDMDALKAEISASIKAEIEEVNAKKEEELKAAHEAEINAKNEELEAAKAEAVNAKLSRDEVPAKEDLDEVKK